MPMYTPPIAGRVQLTIQRPVHTRATHGPPSNQRAGDERQAAEMSRAERGWGGVEEVEARCKGVVGYRTPDGMTEAEWNAGLAKFAAQRS
jgi:hypothetical protein